MSLLITTLRNREIVITSDSRETLVKKDDQYAGFSDTCQKIFPVPDHPLVIAHHGENNLDAKPLAEFIRNFTSALNAGNLAILDVADQFRSYAHPAIRKRLRELPGATHGCGFLFAGFGAEDRGPSVVELFWKRQDNDLITEERQWLPIAVIPSGDGAAETDKPDWHSVADLTVDGVYKYNQHLIDEAVHASAAHNTVGGPFQEVVITREKWRWTIEPPKPAAATQPDKK